jgi:glycosyltransferase involved in cell wall biosynthesis
MDGSVTVHRVPNCVTPLRGLIKRYGTRAVPLVDLVERSVAVNRKLRALERHEGLDLVEFPEFGAEGLVSMVRPWRSVPMVVRLHTSLSLLARLNDSVPRRSPSFWLTTRAERLCVIRASAISAPSREVSRLTAEDMGFDAASVHVMPNPIDIDVLATSNGKNGPSGWEPVVLFVGKVERRKGVHLLGDAIPAVLARHPGVTFEFIGLDTDTAPSGGSMHAYILGRLPERLRTHVVFRGNVPRHELWNHYLRSRVCVFPSLFENFPNTCLEAMSLGRPVVGSRVGGMSEMIEDGISGLLISPETRDIERAIIRMLDDRQWAEGLGACAQRRVRSSFSRDVIGRRLAECFAAIVGRRQCAEHDLAPR